MIYKVKGLMKAPMIVAVKAEIEADCPEEAQQILHERLEESTDDGESIKRLLILSYTVDGVPASISTRVEYLEDDEQDDDSA